MERSAKFDNVKFFLIACVVLGHLGNRFADYSTTVAAAQFWIYLFHMPAFIFVAGLFSKRTVNEAKWGKVVPYIFIYLGMELLNFIIEMIRFGEVTDFNILYENGIPWYALGMFWWLAVAILVRKVKPAYVLVAAIILALFVGYLPEINEFLCLRRAVIFFPFFYTGYLIDHKKLLQILSKWTVRIASIVLIIVTIAISFLKIDELSPWRNLFRGISTYMNIKVDADYAWGFLWRIVAYIISFALVLAIISVMPSFKSYISTVGKKTLAVYFFHGRVIAVSLAVIPGFKAWIIDSNTAVICILFTIAIVFFSSLPCFDWVVKKIMTVPEKIPAKSKA